MEADHDNRALQGNNKQTSPNISDAGGKLVRVEELALGNIAWRSIWLLLSGFGGKYPILFLAVTIAGIISTQLVVTLQPWFLGVWGSQYETHDPLEVSLQ